MADISKINAIALANIAKLDAVDAANIAKVNGLVFSSAPAFTGLLDTYTGAAAGYSTRRLATSATNLMRIREDAGDTETDIGYDSNNELDAAAIATHCGTANGYVVTWYDQAGSNDATQGTEASQPQIYDGTAVITENGKPAVQFDGISSWLTSSGFGEAITRYVTHVAHVNGNGTGYENLWMFLQNISPWQTGNFMQYYSSNPAAGSVLNFSPGNRDLYGSSVVNQQRLGTFVSLASGTEFFLDGTSEDSATATAPVEALEDLLSIGQFSGNFAYMKFQEMVIWNSDETSNRTGIESNVNTYFSIY